MKTLAETYKENGYTHVLVETAKIKMGFRGHVAVQNYIDGLDFNERYNRVFAIYTIEKAIKKGY